MIALRVRAQLRAEWRAWLTWVLVVGVAAGIPLAAWAGAQRTQTTYDRFLAATDTFDVIVTNGATTPTNVNRQFDFDELARRPDVVDAAVVLYYTATGVAPDGHPITPADITPVAPVDGRFGTDLAWTPLLSGRLPQGVDEIALSLLAASLIGVETGDTVAMDLFGLEVPNFAGEANPDPTGRFRVSGIIATPSGFTPLTGGLPPLALLAQDYAVAHPNAAQILAVRLRDGHAGAADFISDLQQLTPDQIVSSSGDELRAPVQRGLDVQATALRLFAVVAAVLWLLLAAQALRRRFVADAAEDEVWRALGAAPGELVRSRAVLGFVLAPIAAVAGGLTAVALSTVFPVGTARVIEIDAGVDVDVALLVLGVVTILAAVVAVSAAGAWWQAVRSQRRPTDGRTSWALRRAPTTGLPTTVATGLRLAVDPGRGRRAVPVRSTMVSLTVGVAAVVGVLVVASSLGRVFDRPELYGWAWDVQVGDTFAPSLVDLAEDLAAEPGAERVAAATIARVDIGDLRLDALAIDPDDGIEPTVVDGVTATTDDEIVLGGRTARDLGVGVGDKVTATVGDQPVEFTVVGRGVFPAAFSGLGLGDGVALTLDGLRRLTGDVERDVVLVEVTPDTAGEDLVERLRLDRPASVYLPDRPADLAALERVNGLPAIVALLLAATGVLALASTLLATVRRRRGELATLQALGFVPRQVGAAMVWQGAVLVVVALVVGFPLGVAGGRLLWRVLVDRLGVPYGADVPAGQLALVAVVALLVGVAVSLLPAVLAVRRSPAVALRAE